MSEELKDPLDKKELGALIGARIKEIRNEHGLTQAELARRCGKDKQHMELIENNKVSPTIHTLYLISHSLGIKLSTLFDIKQL